ncbi:MAG TPA: 2,5-diketo-D-gluconic acid reductase [Prolixibacteraceae bacterium]|nr:2,5-diketo-D-gluconic acid reductase [Prolixibacteraceae bacterium]
MEKKNQSEGMKRRDFIQTSAVFAASAMFLTLSGTKVFGALNPTQKGNLIPTIKLNNGIPMPMVGFGTNTLNGAICERSVSDAISVGYRLIDTAKVYGNEEFVGAGIKQSGIKREELFITSKLWVDDSGYENAKKAFETTLNKLGLEYLDLYLIHRPRGDVKGSWMAMEELCKEGKIRAIGVSNFEPGQLDDLMADAKIKPAINQIETHVFFQEHKSYEALKKVKVQMEAWSPFAAGRNGIFSNQTLAGIGKKHNKSIAQVCLRWNHQRGIVVIPRSTQKAHMIENLGIFDFELDKSDMQTIATLDLNKTQFPEWG